MAVNGPGRRPHARSQNARCELTFVARIATFARVILWGFVMRRALMWSLLVGGTMVPTLGHAAPGDTLIYSFALFGSGGSGPNSGLLADTSGAFFGTAESGGNHGNYGAVYKLTPPPPGKAKWTEAAIYRFRGGTDCQNPTGGVVADAAGALYGTSSGGGPNNSGAVFQLTPPAPGKKAWTEKTLYTFRPGGQDGYGPFGGVIIGPSGALYGTSSVGGGTGCGGRGCGTVFQVTPPAPGGTRWREAVIYRFKGKDGATPYVGLIVDGNGRLYGTTSAGGANSCACGTVFELTPPAPGKTQWSESVLHSFGGADGKTPWAGLLEDATGTLYGTTEGGGANSAGAVFKLAPPPPGQTAWTETVIYSFMDGNDGATPAAGLIADAAGSLYGTTMGGNPSETGTAFKLTPPVGGQTTWTETVLTNFAQNGEINPIGPLVATADGTLYGTTEKGGTSNGGTVFAVTP